MWIDFSPQYIILEFSIPPKMNEPHILQNEKSIKFKRKKTDN